MKNQEIWQAVLAELELSISKANFNTWFKNTGIISLQDGQVAICIPNTFNQAWIEKKYHHQIIQSLERVTGKPIRKLEYRIENIKNVTEPTDTPIEATPVVETPEPVEYTNTPPTRSTPACGGFSLNPKYTFSSFVVGSGSELAFAAAQAVANRPGEAYNPLFIYGGVGLGKTHLLQAVGNELLRKNPSINIMYVSAEKFSNDFITSIKDGSARDFQNRYRQIDALLIDDIQFIAGKDRTQESFFHTFNELHQQNKQVILTSDRPPKAIPALEDRLKSRFEWGMIVDVALPDFETRVAILEKKCAEKGFLLEPKVMQQVAAAVQTNIRELEGTLNKIIAYHQLKNIEPSADTVKSLLSSLETGAMRRSITSRQLIEAVSEFYNVSMEDLTGKSREKKLSYPRQIIMYMLRQELKMSYPSIGDELGGRDHTTAMHAHEKIAADLENDLKLKQEVELIKQRLYINSI
ncbi:MAG: Chromosomal replication initiator protein DnaA [Candidatus Magasanikbacteria bacterium GW2011_GWC2_34_16]|uniref:Chromosomal replication initiator protein DnaA n=2 Tax=Candidatus Magasanikiibacteriota TaxID=1752731 RepID=A0A0G0JVS6_9BACT|nr:MAG: Chromosomal replication initiator protein DnaA [Candidatus Magasanikbacteria bacterium GW2011_GWC2_34_16]KKQ41024.1 MAG: Chromosomal replication initiator protein DnaA [Candidatus Magasanikbacteria bacterium GW2011_GWA2_37_8]